MLTTFLLAILFRTASGFQNGFGYDRNRNGIFTMTAVMIGLCLFAGWFYYEPHLYHILFPFGWFDDWIFQVPMWAYYTFIGLCAIWSAFMIHVFLPTVKSELIHDVETLITAFYILALAVVDPIPLLFAHFPGMLGHKLGVNIPPDRTPWNHNGTDNPTGETVKIFNLNWWRTSFNARIALSVVSLALFIVWKYR